MYLSQQQKRRGEIYEKLKNLTQRNGNTNANTRANINAIINTNANTRAKVHAKALTLA